jgi:phosphate transport system substrate-binding protein
MSSLAGNTKSNAKGKEKREVIRMKGYRFLAVGLLAWVTGTQAAPTQINGAGSTFIYPIFSQWASTYQAKTGEKINYQAIGSGGGIRQISSGTVDFAATDAPLTAAELEKDKLLQFPVIMGGVVPTINVPGIKANSLRLDGETMAAIFSGKITTWNNPAIKKLNPGLALPNTRITVVHRADGSGTTWIFTNYLNKVSESWRQEIGSDKAVKWPVGVGAKGNQAVANYIMRIKGAIGYVELAYVLENKMTSVMLKNREGKFVSPTLANLKAAAANADWKNTPGFSVILTDQPGAESWPITGATFILMRAPIDSANNEVLRKFLSWSWKEGAVKAEALSYVPLPSSLVNTITASWAAKGAK